ISLFFRAWEKYRFYVAHERGESAGEEPEAFTRALFSLVGMGLRSLRYRLRVSERVERRGQRGEKILGRVEDLVLLHYGGFFAHRPRCAVSLETLLQDYFRLGVRVQQFQGQWLQLGPENQSRMGGDGSNNQMGVNLVAGDRVWDVQGKIRVCLGPLRYNRFVQFLPDRSPQSPHK